MSDDKRLDDPFNQPAATPADASVDLDLGLDGAVEADGDDLFGDIDFDLEETEDGSEIKVYESGDSYSDPREVGLKDKMWVPVRLSNTGFDPEHKPRLSASVCIAVKADASGKKRAYVGFDQVEAMLKAGATEVIGERPLPYFLAEANHVAPEYGQRRYPYEIAVPALTVKTAFYNGPRNGRTGQKNEQGSSLRKAAGVTEKGEKVNLETMPAIAERLDDKIVMARLKFSSKQKTRPVKDTLGNQIPVEINHGTGVMVTVFKQTDGSGFVVEGTGEIWEGDESLLVPVNDNIFAISDTSGNGIPLMETYTQVTDYLDSYAPFMPVPERNVQVTRNDGSVAEGQITWETVGAIVKGKIPGVSVDVMLRTGVVITALWFGVEWSEIPAPKSEGENSGTEGDTEGGGLDEFSGVKGL